MAISRTDIRLRGTRLTPRVRNIALLLAVLFSASASPGSVGAAGDGFTFTAAGDYGDTRNTTATLQAVAAAQPAFHLGIGDFNYDRNLPTNAWCDFVKATLGSKVPFELVSGNHEDDSDIEEGQPDATDTIDGFAACFPHRLGTLSGAYAREFFFDYPQAQPLARMIMLSPELSFEGDAVHYDAGSSHYNWVSAVIDDARAKGIQWVIVGAHKPCLTMGADDCAGGVDLTNLLIDKRVDLVLEGHEHNYQRTWQLALGPNCPGVVPFDFDAGCVVSSSDSSAVKGAGTVFVIVGTGGAGLGSINAEHSEAPYFATAMGANSDPTFGYLSVDISSAALQGTFHAARGGSFSDTFSITTSAT